MPMTTMFVRRSSRFFSSRATHNTWATISPGSRWRKKPICQVAQKTQPIAQPACDEMQVVRRRA